MECDEEFARKLQEEFDREARYAVQQYEDDALLAQQLAANSHSVSGTDSESEIEEKVEVKEMIKSHDVSASSREKQNADSLHKSANKRPVCQYGADCYRKNPNHLSEFYHPEKQSKDEASTRFKKCKIGESSQPISEMKEPFHKRLDSLSPFRFFLNKIYSIPETKKDRWTLVFPDLLNPRLGTLIESVQLNFMLDLDFVMKFYEFAGVAKTPVLFMYGQMEGNPNNYKAVTCKKVDMPYQYGVHHSKMMIFHYKEGLRVVVHTANLVPDDWEEKTQGFWISPMFPRLADTKKSILDGESKTNFKRDLIDYLLSYKSSDLERWSQIVMGHDFSSCSVYLIVSVPGYHVGETRFKFGHMKCRTLLRKYSKWKPTVNSPIMVQCSSIGSLGKEANTWLTSEFGASLSGGNNITNSTVNVIYPSLDNVIHSSQGYGGGSCLPYQSKTHEKQTWLLTHMHSWSCQCRYRSRSMPHIKTYTRLSGDQKKAQFFLLTSSNLSKAAWGQLQKQGTQLFIRSYEVGVLWLPQHLVNADAFELDPDNNSEATLGLPYDLPLSPYGPDDLPWLMDTRKSTPDVFGNTYPC